MYHQKKEFHPIFHSYIHCMKVVRDSLVLKPGNICGDVKGK
jgi:hypothetical protein